MTRRGGSKRSDHRVVSPAQWLRARTALLAKEKAFTRARDKLSRQRRTLPWVKVDKTYVFAGPDGQETLAQLFAGRSQLAVYHFMFPPEWQDGCAHCSFWADHYDAMQPHLNARDVSMVVISRAPLAKIEPFRKRMGWRFKWLSSSDSDFNYDFQASFTPEDVKRGACYNYGTTDAGMSDREGLSVFCRDARGIFHTYSCYARGIDMLNGTYQILDLVPKGRDEDPDDPQSWVRYHDRYTT
jgi:predicted dithiol-disulfide oxidoreductase (DUF899 family)